MRLRFSIVDASLLGRSRRNPRTIMIPQYQYVCVCRGSNGDICRFTPTQSYHTPTPQRGPFTGQNCVRPHAQTV